jgi:hypothetical protein
MVCSLDNLLEHGGFETRQLTEIVGPSGSGKTQVSDSSPSSPKRDISFACSSPKPHFAAHVPPSCFLLPEI